MSPEELKAITDFRSFIEYLREELDWDIPDDLGLEQLTYTYTAAELGLKIDAQVEIKQLRPILGQQSPWGVFFIDFDKAELPVTLLRRILSSVSRRKRESANPGDRVLFGKNDLLFVSAFGKADDRKLALAHFHQEPDTNALPTLRVLSWDQFDTPRHMATVSERLARLRWPGRGELPEAWKARWSNAFIDRPRAAISTAKDMAAALADCARQIREAIQDILPREREGQPLSLLFDAVKATLNRDLDVPKFADTYAQTIAYGLLSKRIDQIQRWRAEKARTLNGALPLPAITIDALEQAIPTNPFLSELLTSFLAAGGRDGKEARLDFDELGLGDVVHLLNTANMEAVLDDFDKDKQGDDPVIHFYEGFLAAYDKAMKVQRGVFYTPKPVVSFIVRSVDEALRTEFGLPLGLADTTTWGQFVSKHPATRIPPGARAEDPFVRILDPATGTGTFLVEAIDLIHRRMMDEAWTGKKDGEKRSLWNAYVAEHLLPRLYGYELMMAPYAVAHMKIGLKLADTGYDFSATEVAGDGTTRPKRARVFLTNALESAQDLDMQLAFMNEALAHEARAAGDVKARTRFTVVMGNPPYAGESGNPSKDENGRLTDAGKLIQHYFSVDGIPLQERNVKWVNNDYVKFYALAEKLLGESDCGILGYITSSSWLDGPIFAGVRRAHMLAYDGLTILDLHGNKNRGEVAPDGGADEGMFEISEGTSVTLGRRSTKGSGVRHQDLFGTFAAKAAWLASNTSAVIQDRIEPTADRYYFVPRDNELAKLFEIYPRIDTVMTVNSVGIATARDALTIAFTKDDILARARDFVALEPEIAREKYDLGEDVRDWKVSLAQSDLRASGIEKTARRIGYRPLDVRWTIYTGRTKGFHCMPRPEIMGHMTKISNLGLLSSRLTKGETFAHALVTTDISEVIGLSPKTSNNSFLFPLFLEVAGETRSNLAPWFTARLTQITDLRFDDTFHGSVKVRWRERGDLKAVFTARDVFDWIYGVLHSPVYRKRYADFLKSDFARLPLPKDRDLFAALIPLGSQLVALHLLDVEALPDLLRDPKVRFVSNGGERRLARFNKEVHRDTSGRVYLNDQNWFATVPLSAWEHWIGGYQPAQKWLRDRSETGSKDKLKPGRLLTDEDILHYRRMIVALEETGKVMAEIDEVIARHGGWPDAFKGMKD